MGGEDRGPSPKADFLTEGSTFTSRNTLHFCGVVFVLRTCCWGWGHSVCCSKGAVLGQHSVSPVDEDFSSLVPVGPGGSSQSPSDAGRSHRPQPISMRPWVSDVSHLERRPSEEGMPRWYKHMRDQVEEAKAARRSRSVPAGSRRVPRSASHAQHSHLAGDAVKPEKSRGHGRRVSPVS